MKSCGMTNRSLIDLDALSTLFTYRVAYVTDLLDLGLTIEAVQRRCLPDGPWQRLFPGVVLLSNQPPTRLQLVQGALRYTRGSILTGHDALALHGIRSVSPDGLIHVLLSEPCFVRGRGKLRIERTPSPPKPVLRKGLLVAPLARAAIDAARRMTAHTEVLTLFTEVVFKGGVRLDELNTQLVVGGSRGATLPRRVLHEIAARIRCEVAASARSLVHRAGLPAPRWDVPVNDANGGPLGNVTGTWDDVGLAWDVHAFDFDPAPASYPTALKRGSRLAASGLLVLHTPATFIRTKPDTVIAELRSAHAHSRRPESCSPG
jgi:hypothetical protein